MLEDPQIPIIDEDIKRIRFELNTDPNDCDYFEDLQRIARQEPALILPIMMQVLFDEERTLPDWHFRAESICRDLQEPLLRHLVEPMIPALIAVIAFRYDERKIDPWYVIEVLKQFDLRSFPDVIPVLLNWIQRTDSWRSDETKDAWKIIQQFDTRTLLPYRLIIQSIETNLPHMIG